MRYSLDDLAYAGRRLKWITRPGARLVRQLEDAIVKTDHQMSRHRDAVFASSFGPSLRRHMSELRQARQTYGPMPIHQPTCMFP